jgi:predicted transcriptional regulator
MDAQHLHARLRQLHKELQQIESVDTDERRALQQLMADIHEILEKEEGHPIQKYSQLSEQLRDNVAQLEASHPTVTMLMGQVIDTLAKMGI